MKNTFKKGISIVLAVLMLMASIPLAGFVGVFTKKATAAVTFEDYNFSANDYMAGILLNTNTNSCAVSGGGKSAESMTIEFYTQPQNISLSKVYTEALESDIDFMSAVAGWEVLTFSPSDIYSESLTKQGYYQAILFNILDVAVDYNFIPSIAKNMNKHVISTLKSINELEIKVHDVVVNGDTVYDLLNADQQHQIIQTTAKRMTELEMRNQTLSDYAMIVKTCTTVTDFVEKAAQLSALTTLTEDLKAIIDEMYENCSYIDNLELKAAILEIKTAMASQIDNIGTIGLEMLCTQAKLSMDVFLDQLWGEAIAAYLGSFGAGLLIGQVIGRGLSNILFSTDKTIEQFYTMQALADIEVLMCKTVKNLGKKYIANQNVTNANNYITAIDLLYNTYKLDYEYAADFAEIIYTKGLVNKVKLFLCGTPDSLEKINSIVKSMNTSLSLSLGMITDIDSYRFYLETDNPEVYDLLYGAYSYEELTNKYVEKVKLLTVACPTDVDIFDSNEELVVSIKNSIVELCLPGYICIVENDVKHILLINEEQSSIRITGTDDGEMTYTICEANSSGFDRTMIFKDVTLTQGCTYNAIIPDSIHENKEKYNLIADSGEIIECDSDSFLPIQDNIVDVIVAEELFDGFPVEIIDLVADTMFNMQPVVDLTAYDISTEDAVALFSAVAKYYPAEYSLIANSDFTYKIIVSPNLDRIMKIRFYYGDDANLSTYQKRVNDLNAEINALVAQVEGMTEFEKALYIHDYIVLHSEYDMELLEYMEANNCILPGEMRSEKYTEYSILVNGTGVCGSYALAYRAVLNAAGMECLYLSSRSMNHAWNLVKIDGNWYHVDCCWDDPVPDTYGRARRTYFLRTDKEIMDLQHYSWSPGQYKATSELFSDMPRNYDTKQKYDDGKWYYLSGASLYEADIYGNNKTLLTSVSASSIDADGGNIYYATGRYIYEYVTDTQETNLVYMLTSNDAGSKPADAYISNIYVDDNTVELYKTIYDDENNRLTVHDNDDLQKEKFASVTGITISQSEVSLDVFETLQLTAGIVTNGSADGMEVDWTSSDESIVQIDKNGKITAANVGTATVTVRLFDFASTCDVTVTGDGLSGIGKDNIRWTFDSTNGTLTLSGNGVMTDYSSSNMPWYSFRDKIKTAIIDDGITNIGSNAFYDCSSLNSVIITNSITSINYRAFYNCDSLICITIPNSVSSIGLEAFSYCNRLTSVSCEDNSELSSIGDEAFYYCENLANITIPKSVTHIGDSTFGHCESLASITVEVDNTRFSSDINGVLFNEDKTILIQYPIGNARTSYIIPNSVSKIGDEAFYYCDNLASITIPNSVSIIGDSAFCYCRNLASITIPNSVSNIEDTAFYRCYNLASVDIGENSKLKSIGNSAFGNCTNLESITIPNSVTSIGDKAFYLCDSLSNFTVDTGNEHYCNDEYGVLFNKDKTILIQHPLGTTRTYYTIPQSVTHIGNYAFYSYDRLASITIPNSITSIGSYAFAYCDNLEIVDFDKNSQLQSIGYEAFGNTSLVSIDIPRNVTSIDYNAFACCDSLENITVDENNTHYCNDEYGVLFDKDKTILMQYPIGNKRTNYVIPDGVTDIDQYAFHSCISLTSITLPKRLTEIGSCAFHSCTNLTNIIIPDSVSYIRAFAFYNCDNLSHVGYQGTEKEFSAIRFTLANACLTNAPYIHYNFDSDADIITLEEKAATCTEKGHTKTIYCIDCQCYLEGEVIEATGHSYILTESVVGTCTAAPYEVYTCSACGDSYIKEGKFEDGHQLTVEVISPTCDEKGYTKEVCTVCGETMISEFTSPLGHSFIITRSADYCEAHGSITYECRNCDYTETVVSDPANLVTETVVVDPTCTKSGTKCEICTLCGATVSTEILNPLSHDYAEEFTVDLEATCTTAGRKSQHCTRCDAKRAVTEIESFGHTAQTLPYKDATCTTTGLTEGKKCSVCGEILTAQKEVAALGHAYSDGTVTKEPTCTAKGVKTFVCANDAKHTYTEEIAKLPHTKVLVNAKEATATKNGYTGDLVCADCGTVFEYGKVIPNTNGCSHLCHKDGFIGFIWKIVRFFWKLFKMHPVCECGAAHY